MFLLAFPFHAQIFNAGSTEIKLSAEPQMGITFGKLGEYFYEKDSSGDYKLLSFLEWEESPLATYGGSIDFFWKNLGVNLNAAGALPLRCGFMYDSDWVDLDAVKNNYSISENTLSSYLSISAEIKYALHIKSTTVIFPYAEFMYSYKSLRARNGYGWYGQYPYSEKGNVSWDSDDAKKFEKGSLCGIDYERLELCTFIGLTAQQSIKQRAVFLMGIAVSPFTYVRSVDTHWADFAGTYGTDYLDVEKCCFSRARIFTALYFPVSRILDLGINVCAEAGPLVQGETFIKNHDDKKFYPYPYQRYKSGADIYEVRANISCVIHIL